MMGMPTELRVWWAYHKTILVDRNMPQGSCTPTDPCAGPTHVPGK